MPSTEGSISAATGTAKHGQQYARKQIADQ
jgi:hypothetical protein